MLKFIVFSHEHLYVAISKVHSKKSVKILSLDKEGKYSNVVSNFVYEEVFNNL